MAGILDIIGAMTGASNTRGGIKTMPDGSLAYEPMEVNKPGMDMFLSGGQGRRRAQSFNDQALAALLQVQESNKGRIAEVQERGVQDRLSNADRNRLEQEIANLQAKLVEKQTYLSQATGVAEKYGIPVTNEEDLKTMGGALTDPAIKAALQNMSMLTAVRGSTEGQQAFRQGALATMQAPAVENQARARFDTAPANITTMPQSDASGMINLANTGAPVRGLIPFSEEIQNMTTLPNGMQLPGDVTRRTGYNQPSIPRPPQLKTGNVKTNVPPALPTMPQTQTANPGQQISPEVLAQFIRDFIQKSQARGN